MRTETLSREVDHRSSEEIESDIRQKRDRMDSTLDELGDRLNVRWLMNSALEWWDSPTSGNQGNAAARRAMRKVASQVKQHPMPSLLIGGGLAWLIADSSDDAPVSSTRPGEPERVSDRKLPADNGSMGDTLHHAKDVVADSMGAAKDKLSDLGSRAHASAGKLGHEARERGRSTLCKLKREVSDDYRAASESFGKSVDEYPLAVGIAFAALGALAGIALPRSRKEDELMGVRSDTVVHAAKEKGGELLESGKAVGERVVNAVATEAKEQGFTGETMTDALASFARKGGAVLQKAQEEASQAADDEGLKPVPRNPDGETTIASETR